MNNIKKLKTYDDEVLENIMSQFDKNVDKLLNGHIGLIQAPTGVGKTHSSIQLIIPRLYEKGVRLFFYIAPQKVLLSRTALIGHIKELRKLGYSVSDLYESKYGEVCATVSQRDGEEIILVSMTDSSFNNWSKNDRIKSLINKYGLKRIGVLLDEAHIGSTSDALYYQINTGNTDSGYNAVKFNNVVDILNDSYVIGLTGTPVVEQTDSKVGTDKYLLINSWPEKYDLWKRTSPYQDPIFYDWNRGSMENPLMEFFEMVSSQQIKTDTTADKFNLPDECRTKFTGLIRLETTYLDKEKDDKKQLISLLNSDLTIPVHWDWDLGFDDSKEIRIWRFQNGSVVELTDKEKEIDGYIDSDMLINHLRDKNSRLKFITCVDKYKFGVDVRNWNYGLALRVPGTKNPDGKPVVIGGEQWNGRFTRPTISIETLSKYFDNVQEFIKYYILVNSYQLMIPESDYWRTMMESVSQRLNSVDEVTGILNKYED